ncbi:MAG: glycoside hydrolase family 76 protein [Sphingobacterium sp.]|jgi:predicted alpha-1,6-mannanase (GH76 family)|nr:glycoside hydrolase family 76 protein [Sphingobacterium sp.]
MFKIFHFRPFLALSLISISTVSLCVEKVYAQEVQRQISVNNQHKNQQNLLRAIQLIDRSMEVYFSDDDMKMHRFYNPFTKIRSEEKASVWMYSASIEAVNAVLSGLKKQQKEGNGKFYKTYYARYVDLLAKLHANAAYYLGTFTLTSFTQHKEWTVYAVDRAREKGKANVAGVLNVYDDQMWLLKELLEAYHLTGQEHYLEEAEYLTAYVLDGWDCTLDEKGKEHGGIPWGPGYVTKHACSNAPIISPLVTLYEIYKKKDDQILAHSIDPKDKLTRIAKKEKKSVFYLSYAKRIYDWQKAHLLNENGVYADMMGDCFPDCSIAYETVNGIQYRKNTELRKAVGTAFSYNSGTMLSGAADLYRVTKMKNYLDDGKKLADASFSYFGKLGVQIPEHYTYATDGFNNWFNGILLRGFSAMYPLYGKAGAYLDAFQKNLDYGYTHFLQDGFLPTDLLGGWKNDKSRNDLEGMFMFTYAAQYATLAQIQSTQ